MKTKKISKKLSLNKSTVSHLNGKTMKEANGGRPAVSRYAYICNSEPYECITQITCPTGCVDTCMGGICPLQTEPMDVCLSLTLIECCGTF